MGEVEVVEEAMFERDFDLFAEADDGGGTEGRGGEIGKVENGFGGAGE